MHGEEFIRMKQLRRTKYRSLAPPLSGDWPEFPGATRKRAHLSRLSGARHDRLSCEELADRRAMLLAIAKQGLDHLPNHLAHGIAVVPRGASSQTDRDNAPPKKIG